MAKGWKKVQEPVQVEKWFERDRAHVALQDAAGNTIIEFWDEDVASLVEDGFLDPRNWGRSLEDYAMHLGVLRKRAKGGYEYLPSKSNPKKRRSKRTSQLDVFAKHQVRIAQQTLRMPDAMVGVMGGMTKEQAREILRRYGISARGNPRRKYSKRAKYRHHRLKSPKKFAKKSFRVIDPGRKGHTKFIVACPKGEWSRKRKRCKVGMQKQARLVEKKRKR